jgi:hypothetical protein
MSQTPPSVPLTIGQVARHFGVAPWQVRRLYEAKKLPEPPRVGAYRVVPPGDLHKVEAALRACGYLPVQEGVAHAS